jgi:hypothetical protein
MDFNTGLFIYTEDVFMLDFNFDFQKIKHDSKRVPSKPNYTLHPRKAVFDAKYRPEYRSTVAVAATTTEPASLVSSHIDRRATTRSRGINHRRNRRRYRRLLPPTYQGYI